MRSTASRKICGISCISKNPYFEVIKLVYPLVADISNGMCEEEKNNMRALRNDQLGSCKKAVVTSDGVWHTWTFQQKRVIQYQKLFDRWIVVVWSQVYARQSTSKSMEGILAEECYKQAADEGCKVEVSGKMVTQEQPRQLVSIITMEKFYGVEDTWVRSIEAAKKKEFSTDFKRKYEAQFPSVRTLNCKCERHKAGCG